jgi:hypothetical protein
METSTHKLTATNARAARLEARKYAPCTIKGYTKSGTNCYISFVREAGNKHPVATATRDGKAEIFEATTKYGN